MKKKREKNKQQQLGCLEVSGNKKKRMRETMHYSGRISSKYARVD